MDCKYILENDIHEKYLKDQLSDSEKREYLKHIKICTDCAKDLAKEDPCSGDLVSNHFSVQGAVYFASAMRPTQADAAQQIRRLQDAGLTVIALTSRGPDYSLQTFRELRRNDISFWPGALPPKRGYPGPFFPEGGTRAALYQDGVFLTAGQHKGDMLKALLDKTGTGSPTVVVMADDKAENLRAVMETFEGSGTAVHAWRYSREDANVASLDTQEAAAQWNAVKPALLKIEQKGDAACHTGRRSCFYRALREDGSLEEILPVAVDPAALYGAPGADETDGDPFRYPSSS